MQPQKYCYLAFGAPNEAMEFLSIIYELVVERKLKSEEEE